MLEGRAGPRRSSTICRRFESDQNLHRQDCFNPLQVEGEPTRKDLRLVIRVKEEPDSPSSALPGRQEAQRQRFQEVVQLVPGQLVTRQAVERARRTSSSCTRAKDISAR